MTAEEKEIYTQKFQDYYAFMNNWSKGEHITHLHTSDIVTFETDITDT